MPGTFDRHATRRQFPPDPTDTEQHWHNECHKQPPAQRETPLHGNVAYVGHARPPPETQITSRQPHAADQMLSFLENS
ncbi:hypothetical protein AA3990_0800 [Gluconobacter roseus NBRC 3990]|nr:hypothetical protein AA3990_0800 [Gluconobacter roseus NBRC 3990]